LQIVEIKTHVIRDHKLQQIPVEKFVPGDVVFLSAGDLIPGAALLFESKDFFVDEATLTGETYGVKKKEGRLPALTPLRQRTNVLYRGTYVVSGTAKAIILRTGKESEFGKVATHFAIRLPKTAFEHGLRHFGFFIIELTLVLTLLIFVFNLFLNRSFLL